MRMCRVFPVLACFALVFCDYPSAIFTALTQESPVTAAVGDTTVLRCRTSGPEELAEARWIRIQDGRYSIINIFEDGRDQQRCDLPEYTGRTEVVKDGLAHGHAALKVFSVSVADEGTYRCFLRTVNFFDFVNLELRVTALGSHPRIDIEGFQDGGMKAVCRSKGWYPEPMLVNKDDDGMIKIQREENGLYSIEYSRVITENSNRTFSCMFRTLFTIQEWETSVYVADGLFRKSTNVSIIMFALGLVCLLAALVLLGILYICRKNEQGVSRFRIPFCIRSDPSKKHVILEQQPSSLYHSAQPSTSRCASGHSHPRKRQAQDNRDVVVVTAPPPPPPPQHQPTPAAAAQPVVRTTAASPGPAGALDDDIILVLEPVQQRPTHEGMIRAIWHLVRECAKPAQQGEPTEEGTQGAPVDSEEAEEEGGEEAHVVHGDVRLHSPESALAPEPRTLPVPIQVPTPVPPHAPPPVPSEVPLLAPAGPRQRTPPPTPRDWEGSQLGGSSDPSPEGHLSPRLLTANAARHPGADWLQKIGPGKKFDRPTGGGELVVKLERASAASEPEPV